VLALADGEAFKVGTASRRSSTSSCAAAPIDARPSLRSAAASSAISPDYAACVLHARAGRLRAGAERPCSRKVDSSDWAARPAINHLLGKNMIGAFQSARAPGHCRHRLP
jgi:hypothetical protein